MINNEGVIYKLTLTQNGVTLNWHQDHWDAVKYDRFSYYYAINQRFEIKNAMNDQGDGTVASQLRDLPIALTLFKD